MVVVCWLLFGQTIWHLEMMAQLWPLASSFRFDWILITLIIEPHQFTRPNLAHQFWADLMPEEISDWTRQFWRFSANSCQSVWTYFCCSVSTWLTSVCKIACHVAPLIISGLDFSAWLVKTAARDVGSPPFDHVSRQYVIAARLWGWFYMMQHLNVQKISRLRKKGDQFILY